MNDSPEELEQMKKLELFLSGLFPEHRSDRREKSILERKEANIYKE